MQHTSQPLTKSTLLRTRGVAVQEKDTPFHQPVRSPNQEDASSISKVMQKGALIQELRKSDQGNFLWCTGGLMMSPIKKAFLSELKSENRQIAVSPKITLIDLME